MPFCANFILNVDIWNVLESILMIPLLNDYLAIVLLIKTVGVETFIKVKKVGSLVSPVRRGLNHHMAILTKDLEASGGPYICGDSYTLADVSMVPIFERMEYGRWWRTDSLKTQFPLVSKYWDAIQERDGYKASKPDMVMHNKLVRVGKLIDEWFNDFYEN